MHVPTVECKAYAHTAYRFGTTSAALLVVAHTIANLFGGCVCILSREEFENSTADRRIAAATLVLSWIVLVIGLTLLVVGALMNSQSRTSNNCGLRHHHFLLSGGVLCFVVEGAEGIREYRIDKLIQIAASQLSDQLPESREAAKILALELKSTYKESRSTLTTTNDSEDKDTSSWEDFCQTNLSPLSAQAIIRVTSILKEAS